MHVMLAFELKDIAVFPVTGIVMTEIVNFCNRRKLSFSYTNMKMVA